MPCVSLGQPPEFLPGHAQLSSNESAFAFDNKIVLTTICPFYINLCPVRLREHLTSLNSFPVIRRYTALLGAPRSMFNEMLASVHVQAEEYPCTF